MKLIVGALVGGFILFMWQFASYAALDLHYDQMAHTPNNDKIMQVLSENLTEGQYMVPRVAQDASEEEMNQYMVSAEGKPWAMISYHNTLTNDMPMNMLRGFIINVLAAGLLCFILLKIPNRTFLSVLTSSLAVGLIGYLTINYLDTIWFKGTSIPDLIDAVVQWGLCGVWLGWWLNRSQQRVRLEYED